MGNPARFDTEKLISYSDDLIEFLRTDTDGVLLKQYLQQLQALHSQCNSDYIHLESSIEEYQRKIDLYRQKTASAKSETATDGETDVLQKELDEEFHKECLLREELRVITEEISALDHQRTSMEEREQALKNCKQADMKTEMKLSMYASVTCIIPELDAQSKISGYIVEKDKKVVEKFELDPAAQTSFETCNGVWKLINF